MSQDSVVGKADVAFHQYEHSLTHASDWGRWGTDLAHSWSHISDLMPGGSAPPTATAPPQPTSNEATTTALNNQLNQELSLRASQTYFPSSIIDSNQPATASRVLLGS